jgi:hypothetical protein
VSSCNLHSGSAMVDPALHECDDTSGLSHSRVNTAPKPQKRKTHINKETINVTHQTHPAAARGPCDASANM